METAAGVENERREESGNWQWGLCTARGNGTRRPCSSAACGTAQAVNVDPLKYPEPDRDKVSAACYGVAEQRSVQRSLAR